VLLSFSPVNSLIADIGKTSSRGCQLRRFHGLIFSFSIVIVSTVPVRPATGNFLQPAKVRPALLPHPAPSAEACHGALPTLHP